MADSDDTKTAGWDAGTGTPKPAGKPDDWEDTTKHGTRVGAGTTRRSGAARGTG